MPLDSCSHSCMSSTHSSKLLQSLLDLCMGYIDECAAFMESMQDAMHQYSQTALAAGRPDIVIE